MKNSAARTLSPNPSPVNTIAPAPSGAGADILVVTEDDFFLMMVRQVVTLPNRVWHATSDAQAADMQLSKPCAVALLDIALLKGQFAPVVGRLRHQFPDLGLVATGDPEQRPIARALIERRELQQFISKTDAAQHLAEALESGINAHLELKGQAVSRPARPTWQRGPVLGGILAGVSALVAAAAWFAFSGNKEALPTPNPNAASSLQSASTNSVSAVEVELQKAREAFEAGRYFDGKGDNALNHYKAVLSADPSNAEATDGVHRIAEVLLARAEAALLEGKGRDAGAAIKAAKAIEPGHPRIAFLENQVTRELDRTVAVQQEVSRANETNQKLAGLIRLGNDRLEQDRLVEPANDSARYYFSAARDLDGASLLAQQGLRSLANKLLQKANQAGARGDTQSADQLLAQARKINVSGIDFARAERDLKTAAQRAKAGEGERLLGLARERIAQGQLLDPAEDSAKFYVAAVAQKFPDQTGLAPVADLLRNQLLSSADQTLAKNDLKQAQRLLDEARAMGASGAGVDLTSAAIAAARTKTEALATVAPLREDMIVKSYQPDYPRRAEAKKIEGFVELNFTATVTGEIKDVIVVGAQPAGIFEDAAIRSIKKWRVKPKEVDGQPYEQRLGLRLRFTLAD